MAFHPWPWMVHGSSIPGQAWSMDGPGMAIATFIPGQGWSIPGQVWKLKVRKAQNSLQKLRFLKF